MTPERTVMYAPVAPGLFVTVKSAREFTAPQIDRLIEWLIAIRAGFLYREQEHTA